MYSKMFRSTFWGVGELLSVVLWQIMAHSEFLYVILYFILEYFYWTWGILTDR